MTLSPAKHLFRLLLLLAALWPAGAAAHPHAWIDVEVTVRFDEAGRIAALEQQWLFDAGYTAVALQDMGIASGAEPDPDKLNAFAQRAIDNLGAYGYFTEVRAGDERIAAGAVTELSGTVRDNRLLMRFTMPLAKPAPAGAPLRYAVFDPTFYIEMLHAEKADAVVLAGAPEGCGLRIEKADPDPAIVARAYMLDSTQSGGNELGAHFAEWVTVTCE